MKLRSRVHVYIGVLVLELPAFCHANDEGLDRAHIHDAGVGQAAKEQASEQSRLMLVREYRSCLY